MAGEAHQSDMIIGAARRSLVDQRAGGRRRSIGMGAARIRSGHYWRKVRNIAVAGAVIWLGLGVIGAVIDGIGFTGLMVGVAASAAALFLFGKYPAFKMPTREDLNPADTDVRALVGRTELWLETQRRALPPPAVQLVDQIGLQLDGLAAQLAGVDQAHPKAAEVRKLVGEHLPNVIDGYRKIPESLRYEDRAGSNPNQQFMGGLKTISDEIDSITRQLAMGAIDNLAITTRYLDYKYGDGIDQAEAKP
ncbi:MAG TPA: hypothetical protein VFV30_12280 [Novosphingobium sp.]|nr:hypothetical protein [Novosphingobium sp.]